ncbi:MAG TPA: STAS domain-containing protein, partial [Roseiflexaceae bacterium]|nr:STAS domain-containing protein [Roseiflexaceae bacterium]
ITTNITDQKQVEIERTALQQQVIEAQQAALRELGTPLVPITDGVVAMPLVGAIDSARAQMIMETLLEGIGTLQADVAILDITGVKVVDTQVASALIRAAQAAQLLGARVMLTGISSDVAQSLVQLGANMQRIETRSTLQAAIASALGKA